MRKIHLILTLLMVGLTSNSLKAQSWALQTNPLGSGDGIIGEIQYASTNEGWINVTIGPKLLHTTNAGGDWSIVTMSTNDTVRTMSNPCFNISFINPSMGWVIKGFGRQDFTNLAGAVVYSTTDGGDNWLRNVISQNAGEVGLQIQFVDSNNGWASVANVNTSIISLYKSTNGGNDWNLVSTDLPGIFNFVDANNGWAITLTAPAIPPPYRITKTTDGGANWTTQLTDTTSGGLNAIQFLDLNNGWVVGENGKILKTTNGGAFWYYITNAGIDSSYTSISFYFINTNTGWIGTKKNSSDTVSVLRTTDNGSTWMQQYFSTSGSSIYSIHFCDEQNGGLTTSQGMIYHTIVNINDRTAENPPGFQLSQNFPNPFNPGTKIKYSIPHPSSVVIKIYDVLGKEIETLVKEEKPAGTYELTWNAENLPGGVYFYQLKVGDFVQTKKTVLMK